MRGAPGVRQMGSHAKIGGWSKQPWQGWLHAVEKKRTTEFAGSQQPGATGGEKMVARTVLHEIKNRHCVFRE